MKFVKPLVRILALGSVAFASMGCNGKECKEARRQIDTRVRTVQDYIMTRPEMTNLSNGGCAYMTSLVATYPQQAERVRTLADKKFAETRSECLEYRYEDHWTRPRFDTGASSGAPYERTRICTRWETYTTVTKPYEHGHALKLAAMIDRAYAETNRLCTAVRSLNQADMEASIDALEDNLALELLPQAEKVLAAACGK